GGRVVRLQRQVRLRRHAVPVPGPGRGGREGDRRTVAGRFPRRRLQRLGPGGPDARTRQRPPAAAGDQHRPGHDQPLAGAQGRGAGRHRLRRAVLARARGHRAGGARMNAALRRAMLVGAWVLALVLGALPVVAVLRGWIGAGRWPLRVLRLEGELERVDQARLRETLLPYARRGYFAVPLAEARAAVEKLP